MPHVPEIFQGPKIITGPLALLATAIRHGVTVDGGEDAIVRVCAWLDQWHAGTATRCWWPGTVSLAEHHDRTIRQSGPQRPSWCYGTPGLARAQQLAGLALGDTLRTRMADHALTTCVTDERQLAQLRDASLCHGWAGLLHTVRRVAADTTHPEPTAQIPHLRARLQEHVNRHGLPDQHGLLEGTSGIRLVLDNDIDQPPAIPWDACLLLAG